MDNNHGAVSVERREREFAGFRLLKRIDPTNIDPVQLKWLWERVLESEESFDDFTRGHVEYFLMLLGNPANEFYLVEDKVLVIITNLVEHGPCDIHYLTWSKEWGLGSFKHIAKETLDYVFFERRVHRVTGMIPTYNKKAISFAMSVGMKYEGYIRENYLWHGEYYATHIYGMIDWEYSEIRRRLE